MRFLARILLFVLAVGLILGPGLYIGRDTIGPRLVSWLARSTPLGDGLAGLRFEIAGIGTDHVALTDVSTGDGTLGAEEVDARFTIAALRQGRVRDITLRGLTFRATYDDAHGLDLGPLAPLLRPTPDGEPVRSAGPPPFERLTIEDARVALTTPWGPVKARLSLTAEADPDGAIAAAGRIRLGMTSGSLAGGGRADAAARFAFTMDRSGGVVFDASFAEGSARFRDLDLDTVTGTLLLHRPASAAINPSARASLDLKGLRLTDLNVPLSHLEALWEDDSASATLSLGGPRDTANGFAVALALDGLTGDRTRLALTADGALSVPMQLAASLTDWPLPRSDSTLALRLNAALPGLLGPGQPVTWADLARRSVATGELSVNSTPASRAKGPATAAVSGRLALTAASGLVELRVMESLRVDGTARTWRKLAALVPAPVRHVFDAGLRAELKAGPEAGSVLLDLRQPGVTAKVSAEIEATSGARQLALAGAARLTTPESGTTGGWSADIGRAHLRVSGIGQPGWRIGAAEASYRGLVTATGGDGRFTLSGDMAVDQDGLSMALDLRSGGMLSRNGTALKVEFDSLRLQSGRAVHAAAGLGLAKPMVLTAPPGAAGFSLAQDGTGNTRLEARLDLVSEPIHLRRDDDEGGDTATITLAALRTRLAGPLTLRDMTAHLVLDGLDVDDPALPARLSGITAETRFTLTGATPRIRAIDLRVNHIRDRATPARFAPLKVALSGLADRADDMLTLQGAFGARSGAFSLPLTGRWHQNDGAGRMDLPRAVLAFGPNGLAASDISPLLADRVESLSGRLGLAAAVSWMPGGTLQTQSLVIVADDLSLSGPDGGIDGLSGDVVFNRLAPLTTDGTVTLAADELMLGVAVANPWVEFAVRRGDTVDVTVASGNTLGGTVSAENLRLSVGKPVTAILRLDDIDAAVLANLVKVEGLQATGSLSGSLPVTWAPDIGISVVEAELSAQEPGTVRYVPGPEDAALREAGEQVSLMLDALSNFNYTALGMTVNGQPETGYSLGLTLEGANPELYDGYPLRFNLTLTGQLDDIIKTGYRTYAVPTRVQELVVKGAAGG